jgi:hypothetical protein
MVTMHREALNVLLNASDFGEVQLKGLSGKFIFFACPRDCCSDLLESLTETTNGSEERTDPELRAIFFYHHRTVLGNCGDCNTNLQYSVKILVGHVHRPTLRLITSVGSRPHAPEVANNRQSFHNHDSVTCSAGATSSDSPS